MSGITWLGHGSFQIDTPAGARVLIDPWFSGNPSWPEGRAIERCDAILLTHGHGDHAGDAAASPRSTRLPSPTYPEMAGWLDGQGVSDTVGFGKGGAIDIAGLHVTMTNAVHSSSAPDGTPIGDPGGLRDRGARHADDLRRGRHGRPRRHGPDRRDLRARDRHPPDRRPLHDGPAPGRLRRAADRRSRDRARSLRHVRAADRHARGAARRARAHRRQRDRARGQPGEVVRAFA